MINYSKAFSFMFEDKNWVGKIFLGAVFNLLSLILVGIPFTLGYLLELAKNSKNEKELPLPEWDKLGDKFVRGLVYLVILIIFSLPGAILHFIPCVGHCLGPLYFVALLFVLPFITVKYAQTGSLEEVFHFNEMFDFIKSNINSLIIVVLLTVALEVIASFGILALVVGIFFTIFWADLAIYYLYGKIYREGEAKKGSLPGVAPPSGSSTS
ncbi:MAG: DUF4013 domain-containing protein [Candidatus Zixiibacteriota bacterium]